MVRGLFISTSFLLLGMTAKAADEAIPLTGNITFADKAVKQICVSHWDSNGDGELSYEEAAAVTSLEGAFTKNTEITSFDEFQYFTNITNTWNNTFFECKALKSVKLPPSLTIIGGYAFYGCESLKEIVLPDSLTAINIGAFWNCYALEHISIPDRVETLGQNAFAYCRNLTSVNIPKGVTALGMVFIGCQKLKSIDIPNWVTSLTGTFQDCKTLSTVHIPASIVKMYRVFENCNNLLRVETDITEPSAIETSFSERTLKEGLLIVPQGSSFEYETTKGWKQFAHIVEADPELQVDFTLTVETEGTLSSIVESQATSRIEHLTLKGRLNAEDISFIRQQSGKLAHLRSLDLKDVVLIPGDTPYYTNAITYLESWMTDVWRVYISDHNGTTDEGYSGFHTHNYRIDSNSLAYAFTGLNLQKVVMPADITQIGEEAFSNCGNLQEVICAEKPTSIGRNAFYDCWALTSIPSLERVEEVASGAFQNCYSLSGDIDLSHAKYIGESAFSGCYSIASVSFSNCLKSVDAEAFQSCSALEHVSVDADAETIFSRTSFRYTPWESKGLIADNGIMYLGRVAMAVQPDTKPGELTFRESTYAIAHDFMDGNTYEKIRTVNLPASVRKIGKRAFGKRYSFKSNIEFINFPEGLEEIGEEAFSHNLRIQTLSLPNSLKKVGKGAFFCMEKLTEVANYNVPFSEAEVFQSCKALEKVHIGADVQMLSQSMFGWCSKLTEVEFEERPATTPLTLGEKCFECCQFPSIVLPEGTDSIMDGAFSVNDKLATLSLPNSLRHVGSGAVKSNYITSLTLPPHLQSFEKSFTVPKLQSLTVKCKETGDWSSLSDLKDVVLEEGVEILSRGAFLICHKITELILPQSLKEIGSYALCSTDIEQISIPANVKSLGGNSFNDCRNLMTMFVYNPEVITATSSDFKDMYTQYCKVYVPDGSVEQYKAAEGWRDFKNILPLSASGISGVRNDLRPFDVYDLQGRRIRSGVTTWQDLPKGVYVINGKKIRLAE